jgi:hypothetical protein
MILFGFGEILDSHRAACCKMSLENGIVDFVTVNAVHLEDPGVI